MSVEVILVGHLHGKIGAEQAWAGAQGQEETYSDSNDETVSADHVFKTDSRLALSYFLFSGRLLVKEPWGEILQIATPCLPFMIRA